MLLLLTKAKIQGQVGLLVSYTHLHSGKRSTALVVLPDRYSRVTHASITFVSSRYLASPTYVTIRTTQLLLVLLYLHYHSDLLRRSAH
jgi:hypothetical protein